MLCHGLYGAVCPFRPSGRRSRARKEETGATLEEVRIATALFEREQQSAFSPRTPEAVDPHTAPALPSEGSLMNGRFRAVIGAAGTTVRGSKRIGNFGVESGLAASHWFSRIRMKSRGPIVAELLLWLSSGSRT